MSKLAMYQVDAFANKVFQGNPAAVVPLEKWLSEEQMQNIATENNLSETAFFIPVDDGYHLRWFTPVHEARLCGHATLAAAYVVFKYLRSQLQSVRFHTLSGILGVKTNEDMLFLDFPRMSLHKTDVPQELLKGLQAQPEQVFKTVEDTNYYAIFDREEEIFTLKPNLDDLAKLFPFGVVVTAPGKSYDFVSRYFAPGAGIPEDPVTGSVHCGLIPYWSDRIGKTKLLAKQVSKRGGELYCELSGDRVSIGGKAALYLEGTIYL